MELPKHYRRSIYTYIEKLLDRPLTFEEHDDLRDMMTSYVFSTQNLGNVARRVLCRHEWVGDQQVEGGQRTRVHMKCRKCDKRVQKRIPLPSL